MREDEPLPPGWCHCMSGTYGSWLPGDSRGFRTRYHREHIEGDYKSPPAVDYSDRHAAAKERMPRPAVELNEHQRHVVLEEVVDALKRYEAQLIAACVAATHMHILGRFTQKPVFTETGLPKTSAIDDPVRHLIGKAKQWSSKRLIREGLMKDGIWAKRGKIVRIHERSHQVNVFKYIVRHRREGAAVWTYLDDENKEAGVH